MATYQPALLAPEGPSSFSTMLNMAMPQTAEAGSEGSEPMDCWARNFRFKFPPDYPKDLETKLESLWKCCKSNKERQAFEDMYYSNLVQVFIPGSGNRWTTQWRETLGKVIQLDKSMVGADPVEYRSENMASIRMAERLLAL